MSTRAVIANGTFDKFRGVYSHSDGYPTWLGVEVWKRKEEISDLIDKHPDGFSSFPEVCYCHDEYFSKRDGSSAPDSPQYNSDKEAAYWTEEVTDWLFIEWAYIFDDKNLYVVKAKKRDDKYMPVLVGTFPLDGEEPDWNKLERSRHG